MSDEESGEELLDEEKIANDYRAIPELDQYEDKDIDYRCACSCACSCACVLSR